jgi:glutamate N-acetyltransferase/amino-acid N-acetyltransferase
MMTDSDSAFFPVPGIRLAAVAAGVKYAERLDLLLIELSEASACAAVFTQNAFCAAPVIVSKEHLQRSKPNYLLINAGNANAGTGSQGMHDAGACCDAVAALAACRSEQVLPFSTGVIGENLPVDRICAALPEALAKLDAAAWPEAAQAIMTTDTAPKLVSRQVEIDGQMATVTGIAKGAGMIRPDMATMLSFIATDAPVRADVLQAMLRQAVEPSFNAISVDGDTSTNDACVLMASGALSIPTIDDSQSAAGSDLLEVVSEVCMELAAAIVRDAEGATKLVHVRVSQAQDREEARQVAYTIAHSPLVKTALFAADPNWGRILAAVGRAGLRDLDIAKVEIYLDDECIVRDGGRYSAYTEQAGKAVMEQAEFAIGVRLGRGEAEAEVLTCDLSYEYVRINAEYRT